MAYIGREPLGGEVILMNSIESQFNGVLTTFNLTRTVSGVTSAFYPVGSQQLLVSLGGVIQKPDPAGSTGFRISFNQIIFAVAPIAATSCFIISYGNLIDIGAPANNTVSTDKLVDGSVTPIKLSTGGPWWLSNGNVGIGTVTPSTALQVVGTVTATTFVGALTGTASNVTTNANLTGHITSVGNAAVLGSFTSANLATALTDETGSGSAVFAISPTLVTSVNTSSTSFDVFNTTATTVNAFGVSTSLNIGATTGTTTIRNNLVVPLASAATPSLTFTGDPNTGIFSPGADQVAISTNGTGRLFVDANGNVGVGTANPLQSLHIQGNLLVAAGSSTGQHITQRAYELNSGTLSWEGSAGQLFSITNNLTSGSIFSVNDVSGIPSIDVDANGTIQLAPYGGNVGIGTVTPSTALQVVGTVTATTFVGALTGTAAGTGSIELVRGNMANNDYFRILVGGTAPDAGFAEIATADNGTEPIHVRQYTGIFATLARTATLLDESGNTSFPGTVQGTRLISTIATGTAPLTVTSTTLVTNLNADLLDGENLVDNAATANTVVGRNASGDIFARLIRQTYANQTTISGGMVFRVNDSTDNYLRVCSDTAAIRTFLNVPTRTGGDASGTWGINITGNIASTAAVTINAGGTNQNITLTPSGTGTVNAPTFNATSTTSGGFQGIDADSATTPSFTWSGALDTGMYRVGTNSIGFTVGGVNRLTVDGNTVSFVDTLSNYNTNINSLFIDFNLAGSTALTANRTQVGIRVDLDHTATGGTLTDGTRETVIGLLGDVDTSGTPYNVYGMIGEARSSNITGTINSVTGVRGRAEGDSGTGGTTTAVYGIQGDARDGGAGTVSSVYGAFFFVLKETAATATLSVATAMRAEVEIDANTITTAKAGEFIINIDGGILTNAYLTFGSYEGTIQAGCWNLYYPSNAPSFINGELRLGANTDLGTEKLQVTGNVRATGSITGDRCMVSAGTNSAPSITFTGDLDTGFWRPAADTVAASTAGTERIRINSSGELLIGYTTDNGAYRLQVNSQIFATSATIATSDGRYKENVATLDGCVDLVKALRPVSFDWKEQQDITRVDDDGNEVLVREGHNFPGGTQVGFIAQEVQEVLAEKPWLTSVIKQNVRPAVTDNDGNELAPEEEFLGIAEGNLMAVLASALQEAIGEIESLKARLTAAGI